MAAEERNNLRKEGFNQILVTVKLSNLQEIFSTTQKLL